MPLSRETAAKAVSALIATAVALSVVAAGGVATTDSEDSNASSGDVEPNDSMANATPIEYGEEINGTLSSPDDVDYYAVNATAGDGLLVTSTIRLEDIYGDKLLKVDVLTPSGEVSTEFGTDQGPQNLAGATGFTVSTDDTARTADVMETNGTYYVRVQESDRAMTNESDTYEYNLTVNREELDAYDPNENGTTATRIELGETLDAVFAGYDSDVFAVNLTAGRTYTLDIEMGEAEMGPGEMGPDHQVWVYDRRSQAVDDPDWRPNGTTVVKADASSADTVTFTAAKNGTHYVQIAQALGGAALLASRPYSMTVRPSNETPPENDTGQDQLPSGGDFDEDGLSNGRERDAGTDPRSADTDGDGLTDDCEFRNDLNPTDPDTDGDGTPDGREV